MKINFPHWALVFICVSTSILGCYRMNVEPKSANDDQLIALLIVFWIVAFYTHLRVSRAKVQKFIIILSVLGFLVLPLKYAAMILPYLFSSHH